MYSITAREIGRSGEHTPRFFFFFLIDALRLILRHSGVLVVSFKGEVYIARLSLFGL